MSRLRAAIRAKFSSPEACLRALASDKAVERELLAALDEERRRARRRRPINFALDERGIGMRRTRDEDPPEEQEEIQELAERLAALSEESMDACVNEAMARRQTADKRAARDRDLGSEMEFGRPGREVFAGRMPGGGELVTVAPRLWSPKLKVDRAAKGRSASRFSQSW
jgi:hypothetical protein